MTKETQNPDAPSVGIDWARPGADWTARYPAAAAVIDRIAAVTGELSRLREACRKQDDEICQTLGHALGWPLYADDQANFPGATEANGVIIGDEVAETMAAHAARRITALESENGKLRAALKTEPMKYPQFMPKTVEQVLGYFVEECGEALAAAGKTQRWGLEGYNPFLPEKERETNRAWLLREIDDVERAIAFTRAALGDDA